jgi:hypothetical protein
MLRCNPKLLNRKIKLLSPVDVGKLPNHGKSMSRFSLFDFILFIIVVHSNTNCLGPLLTLKVSSRCETFPHTYKLTTSPFHNRCEITPTISPSHIGPWVGAATTRLSSGLLSRDFLVNLSSDTICWEIKRS